MDQIEKILFIGDSLSALKLKSDSSLALAEAALKRGKKVFWCEPQNLCYFNQEIFVTHSDEIISVNISDIHYKKSENSKIQFEFFQLCFVRKDPPFDEEYKNLCWLLTSQNKVKIVNSAESLLSFHEKSLHWRAYAEGVLSKEHMIHTCLTHQISIVEEFCEQFSQSQKYIAKPWLGHGGEDISLFENKNLLLEFHFY